MQDLQLREFSASERVTGYVQELLIQYQSHFFVSEKQRKPSTKHVAAPEAVAKAEPAASAGPSSRAKAKPKATANKKRKVVKCPWSVTGQRVSAFHHIRALDKMIWMSIGIGLIYFGGIPNDRQIAEQLLYEGTIPPALTLSLDEGSPAYAMTWYLQNKEDLRFIHMRDPYHREWNDVKGGITGAGLWYVILLCTVVFNLPHGPWEGGKWFQDMKAMSEEESKSMSASNPLRSAVYPLVCKDLNIEAVGTPEHKGMVLEMMFAGDAFKIKGDKVSLRRWFSWLAAADKYLGLWHQRMFALIGLGQTMKVYKKYTDVPLWGNCARIVEEDEGDEPGDEEEEEADDDNIHHGLGSRDANAAQAAADAAEASNAKASEEKESVKDKTGAQQLKELRKNIKNTLFVALAVLCKDNLRFLVMLILEVTRPIWTAHSEHARDCRAPDNVLAFYMKAALESFMPVLEECASVLMNSRLLDEMGFEVNFGAGLASDLIMDSDYVQMQNGNACHMVELFCHVACHRMGSMLGHSINWMGKMVLLASQDDEVYKTTVKEFCC